MKQIDAALLVRLSQEARGRDRLRTNHNMHEGSADPVQRLLNAMEPSTYVQPHRHEQPAKPELFVGLKGAVVVLLFDEDGRVVERAELRPGGPTIGVEVPRDAWHTLAALEPGSVVLEVKPGPYNAATDKAFAAWSPAESEERTAVFEAWFRRAEVGDRPPPL